MTDLRLVPLECGWLSTAASSVVAGANGDVDLPIPSWLVVHPSGQTLLFDTGLHHDLVDGVAGELAQEGGAIPDYIVGTMIELPRAALRAGDIAEIADFVSFGTNDLTQTTLGISRDDAASFMDSYVCQGLFTQDPFASLDQEGVGELIETACQRGRESRPGIKLGVCGEHGGDPASVKFCHHVGMNYVSCSPYRVPIARLAAAQAVAEE